MSYSVAFYCPDRNLKIGGDTPETEGLGGGKTAIIKMADAISRAGHGVKVYSYCREGTYGGVEYLDFPRIEGSSCDVLIAITGSRRDVSELYGLNISAGLKILWLSGCGLVENIDDTFFDWYYANSVFLKKRAVLEWKLPYRKVMATHQGYDPTDFAGSAAGAVERNPLGIVFASHPSKGLDRVLEIISRLRRDLGKDLTLDVYGGYALWGDPDVRESAAVDDWMRSAGIIPQPELCSRLHGYSLMLHLTDYEDTSSVLIHQAKRAGVVVIASDVGGNSELIVHGFDGFIVTEHYRDEACYEKVKNLVAYLTANRPYSAYISRNAERHVMTWDKTAREWVGHWDDITGRTRRKRVVLAGYYGFGNLGDEAILSAVVRDVLEILPDADLSVVSGDPFATERTHRVRALSSDDLKSQTDEARSADAVLLGGGGLFQDHHRIKVSGFFEDHRSGVASYANLPLMGKIFNKPVVYFAHGVGPLFSEESVLFTRWAFGLADYISVRDEYSYRLLVDILGLDPGKVLLGSDPVCSLHVTGARADHLYIENGIPMDKKIICVSLRKWIHEPGEKRTVENVAGALDLFLDRHPEFHIVFIPFHLIGGGLSDLEIIEEVAGRISVPNSVVRRYSGPADVIALYRAAEFSVGMRYHSLVFSALVATPAVCISYDEKDHDFMTELGLEDLLLPVRQCGMDELAKMMESVSGEGRNKTRERMQTGMRRLEGRHEEDRESLRRFLTDGR